MTQKGTIYTKTLQNDQILPQKRKTKLYLASLKESPNVILIVVKDVVGHHFVRAGIVIHCFFVCFNPFLVAIRLNRSKLNEVDVSYVIWEVYQISSLKPSLFDELPETTCL